MRVHHCNDQCHLSGVLSWTWCVTYLQQLIACRPEWAIAMAAPADIGPLGSYVGLAPPPAGAIALVDYSDRIDRDRAAAVDLTQPILIVTISGAAMWPIDGWHRIYRALSEGLDSLPALVLTPEATAEAMVWGPPLPPPVLRFAEDEREPGPTVTEDEAANQVGDGWSRRFWATAPADDQDSELYAMVDVAFYVDRFDSTRGLIAHVPVQITCESSYILCTDRTDPEGTERWGDTHYTTVTEEGPFTSERARELCAAFTPGQIRWDGTVNGPLPIMR